MAIQVVDNVKERDDDYNAFSKAIDDKIQENHNAYIRHVRRLKRYTERIIQEDPHEYANKLVSMNFQLGETKGSLF